jgi:hypothetical protein
LKCIADAKHSLSPKDNPYSFDTFIISPALKQISSLNDGKSDVNNLHDLTSELNHKDELIMMLKQQLSDKQKDNEFLKKTVNSG